MLALRWLSACITNSTLLLLRLSIITIRKVIVLASQGEPPAVQASHIRFYLCPQHACWSRLDQIGVHDAEQPRLTSNGTEYFAIVSICTVPLSDGVADKRARHTPHNYKAAHTLACLNDVCGTQDRNPQLPRNITRVPEQVSIRRN